MLSQEAAQAEHVIQLVSNQESLELNGKHYYNSHGGIMRKLKFGAKLFVKMIFLGLFSVSSAQVIEGNVTLNTQAEVNSFAGTSITGSLTIEGSDIVDLTPLSTLTSVGGYLIVRNSYALTTLDGLSNLTSVGNGLKVEGNTQLSNLDGLSNIVSVGGYLSIRFNHSLSHLDGLSNITSVGGDLIIYSDTLLINLDGLSNITSVGGDLTVSSNTLLANLDGLSNLTSAAGALDVWGNASLTNLDGLSNITSVGGRLQVYDNTSLTNLDGLSNIISVGGDLTVSNNASLNRFCGLYPLLSSGVLGGICSVWGNLVNPTQQQIIDDGPCVTSVLTGAGSLPKDFYLQQNYPNPFNPSTTIRYGLPKDSNVSLVIYDVRGQLVQTIASGHQSAGWYDVVWNGETSDGKSISTGIYFARLLAGEYSQVVKMLYLK